MTEPRSRLARLLIVARLRVLPPSSRALGRGCRAAASRGGGRGSRGWRVGRCLRRHLADVGAVQLGRRRRRGPQGSSQSRPRAAATAPPPRPQTAATGGCPPASARRPSAATAAHARAPGAPSARAQGGGGRRAAAAPPSPQRGRRRDGAAEERNAVGGDRQRVEVGHVAEPSLRERAGTGRPTAWRSAAAYAIVPSLYCEALLWT